MSPVAVGLDGLLAVLLVLALGLGLKLNARLKGLRDSQAGFAAAVVELNHAAARAEAGLAALKTASETTHDDLLARIETARGLVARLERAGAEPHREPDLASPRSAGTRPLGGTLAAIAALAEGRSAERPSRADPPPSTRRPARAPFDDELFEAPERGTLGPLHPPGGER